MPEIIEDNPSSVMYTLNGNLIQIDDSGIDVSTLDDGSHILIINAIDKFGLQSLQTFEFVVDKTFPTIELISQNNTTVSKQFDIQVSVSDQNLPKSGYLSYLLPNGERIVDKKSHSFDTSDLEEGKYLIDIFAKDKAENTISSKIFFEVDHSITDPSKPQIMNSQSQFIESNTNYFLIIIIGIIATVIVSVLVILKQKSKIPQKN